MALVYRHRRLDDFTIFYVGIELDSINKTKLGKRPYVKSGKSKWWKNIVNKISSFRETIKGDDYNVKFYDSIVEDIKNLKKKYLNMYKKETNIFKEDIAFLYNIKNGKNL